MGRRSDDGVVVLLWAARGERFGTQNVVYSKKRRTLRKLNALYELMSSLGNIDLPSGKGTYAISVRKINDNQMGSSSPGIRNGEGSL